LSAADPNFEKAQTVVAPSDAIATRIEAARDALYIQLLAGGISKMLRLDFRTGRTAPVNLPFAGAITGLNVDPREAGIIINMQSWTKSPAYYFYDPSRREVTDTSLQPASPTDFSGVEVGRVKAKSYDGTMIPLTILYKRGFKHDGKHRTVLEGYGAYGFSVMPIFNPVFIPWLEQGGVYAFPHIRGGGEYGREWHLAGFQKTKPNSWKDYLACAEYLVREAYTSPRYLAASGGSAGALVIGNAITERPDLFGAAFLNAGYVNVLRGETTPNGIANVPEFGSVKTEAGFVALRIMDAYQNVKDGIAYPAVLLDHGINDQRVPPWMSAKMAARLQAATSSDKPVLLRIDYDAGHGVGATKEQRNQEQADVYAFLFQQLGSS
jgi:prolyl oligopeptidase